MTEIIFFRVLLGEGNSRGINRQWPYSPLKLKAHEENNFSTSEKQAY